MDDSEIVELYWQRNEDAIDKNQENYLTKIAYNILANRESVNDTYLAASPKSGLAASF